MGSSAAAVEEWAKEISQAVEVEEWERTRTVFWVVEVEQPERARMHDPTLVQIHEQATDHLACA